MEAIYDYEAGCEAAIEAYFETDPMGVEMEIQHMIAFYVKELAERNSELAERGE